MGKIDIRRAVPFCVAILMAFSFDLTNVANAQTSTEALLAIEGELNSMCRGWSGDDPHTGKVCDVRDSMHKLLGTMGYCYGKQGQAGYQMQWHKCTGGSNRP